ncbi:MAG: oligosaccharide flippase family protein [Marinilabiliaceae bacterium]|nr:oligosaccharide flippase family protein [Marinilabiliaceae bacterium]
MRNNYIKNTLSLLSGNSLGQLITIGALPILSRLYSTSDLGTFFFVISLSTIAASVLSLQSHLTIVLSKNNAYSDLNCSLLISIITHLTFQILIIFLLLPETIFGYKIPDLIFYSPVISFLTSTQLSFEGYLNHGQHYKILSQIKILRASIMVFIQIIPALIWQSFPQLLIYGYISSLASINLLLFKHIKPKPFTFNMKLTKTYWVNYRHILTLNTPIALLNTASNQLPYIFINTLFGSDFTGYYGMAQRIVGTPLSLLGQSIGTVFYQKAAKFKNQSKRIIPLIWKTAKMLLKYGILPLIPLIIVSRPLLKFFLGNEWDMTGLVIQLLSPWLLVSYLNYVFSYLISVLKLQSKMIWYEIFLLSVRAVALYCGYYFFVSFNYSIAFFSLTGFISNLTFISLMIHFTLQYEQSRYKKI